MTYSLDNYDFKPENVFDQDTRKKIVKQFKGRKLDSIYYVIVNYDERFIENRGFHAVDLAVCLKFSDGEWLNWIWLENGFNEVAEYNLVLGDIRNKLNQGDNQIIEVSNTRYWIGKKREILEDLSFGFFESDNIRYFSDLGLTLGGKQIVICATDEPDFEKLPVLQALPYANDWSVIVFDTTLLQQFDRVIKQ